MAKIISICDSTRFKFSRELMNHWEKLGHTVLYSIYWNPAHVKQADVAFFDWVDNSLMRASNPDDEFYKTYGERPKDKKIIARCHDIDAWCEHYKKVDWNWVNDLVFVADHIKGLVCGNQQFPESLKIHTIKHGINPERFAFRNKPKGNKIAWVGRIVPHKCIELALQVLAENPEYELHAVGSSLDSWELYYVDSFVKRNGLKFFHYPQVDDMNTFLEDKDFILLTSFKEAFSYIIGEAASKGLKPLIHWFWGAETVWPKEWLWNRVSEVKEMLNGEYNPSEYRNFIAEHYSLDRMLEEYDRIMFK